MKRDLAPGQAIVGPARASLPKDINRRVDLIGIDSGVRRGEVGKGACPGEGLTCQMQKSIVDQKVRLCPQSKQQSTVESNFEFLAYLRQNRIQYDGQGA